MLHDDLGYPLKLTGPPQRVISLVPSLTEAIADTVPGLLVGATDWCTHPVGLDVPRVRGTKNPNRAAIIDLRPDLVVANREENRRHDVELLREAGIDVWVTEIETVDAALRSLRRLFTDVLAVPEPGWLTSAAGQWAQPPPLPPLRTIVPIWRDPWMVVGARTFTGDLLTRLGLAHAFAGSPDRYPRLELAELTAAGAELVILPDEPYCFTATDGPEAFAGPEALAGPAVALVPGRSLTWYGPSLASTRTELIDAIRSALRTGPGRLPRNSLPSVLTLGGADSGTPGARRQTVQNNFLPNGPHCLTPADRQPFPFPVRALVWRTTYGRLPMAADERVTKLEDFLAERGRPLLRLAALLGGGREAGEDLLQAALERLLRRWSKFEGDPEGYLRRTLYHLVADDWRRQRRWIARLPRLTGVERGVVADGSTQVDQRDELFRLLLQLTPRQRAAIVLRYWEDRSEAETAEMLGCSVGTVKSATSRGLARMRELSTGPLAAATHTEGKP